MSYAKPSVVGIGDVEKNGDEATGVGKRGAEGRFSEDFGVPGDVMGAVLGEYIPKNLRVQLYLPSIQSYFMWNISVSFGMRGFDANGGLRIIGREYPNSPSMIIPAVFFTE